MAETEPTTDLPKWANLNPTDPVSLQDAIVEPSTSKKNDGFIFKERPPRQDFNWFFNLAGLWNAWFKQEITAQANPVLIDFAPTWTFTGMTGGTINQPGNKIVTSVHGKVYMIFFRVGYLSTENSFTGNISAMEAILPFTTPVLGADYRFRYEVSGGGFPAGVIRIQSGSNKIQITFDSVAATIPGGYANFVGWIPIA